MFSLLRARCDIRKHELSIKGGSISNLGKHLRSKHVSAVEGHIQAKRAMAAVKEAIANGDQQPSTSSAVPANNVKPAPAFVCVVNSDYFSAPADSKHMKTDVGATKQNKMSAYTVRPASVTRQNGCIIRC